MKSKLPYILLAFFGVISFHGSAQHEIGPGNNRLSAHPLSFGKLNTKVTPIVYFNLETPDRVEIVFETKWTKKGDPIADEDNKLLLIDNQLKFTEFINANGRAEWAMPMANIKKDGGYKSIRATTDGTAIQPKKFNNGYIVFPAQSDYDKVIFEGIGKSGTSVQFTITFIHAEVNRYNFDINSISSPKEVTWKFSLPQKEVVVDCDDLQKRYASQVDEVVQTSNKSKAMDLKDEILKDKSMAKCPEVSDALLEELNTVIIAREVVFENEQPKPEPKTTQKPPKEKITKEKPPERKKSVSLDEQWAKLESEYNQSLSRITEDFNNVSKNTKTGLSDLEGKVADNAEKISLLGISIQEGANTKEELTLEHEYLQDVHSENKANLETIRKQITNLKTSVRRKQDNCKSAFTRIDEEEGTKRSKELISEFSKLQSGIGNLYQETDDVLERIEENGKELLNLMAFIDKDKQIGIIDISSKYDSLFANYYVQIIDIEAKFYQLKNEFEGKRYSRWYLKGSKNSFIDRTEYLEHELFLLIRDDSITKEEKNREFARFDYTDELSNEQAFDKIYSELGPAIIFLKGDIEEWPTRSFPTFYLILFLLLAAILGFGGRVYYKALKARRIKIKPSKATTVTKDGTEKTTSGGITITKTITNNESKGQGLKDVWKKAGKDYLEIDLNEEWDDSVVKNVFFERSCIIKTYRFFEDSIRAVDSDTTANETGGYLIGRWDYNRENRNRIDVSLEDFIEPGDDATFSRYQLNFGAKIGVKLQKVLENRRQKEGRDIIQTAWFHSHPGLKIFLSDYDLTVQKDFSKNDSNLKMVALVIDPYTEKWETGIFTYQASGLMNNSKDSKKFFSLDDMYHWALNKGEAKEDSNNFFAASLSSFYADSTIDTAFFTNPCILEIKRHLEDNASTFEPDEVITFLEGDKVVNDSGHHDIVLNKLHNAEPDENDGKPHKDLLACIIKSQGDIAQISKSLENPELQEANVPLVLAFNFDENSFTAVSKSKGGEFNAIPGNIKKLNFDEMVAWTRKRK
jgi:proteasome lid subunit RPN8/RPN11